MNGVSRRLANRLHSLSVRKKVLFFYLVFVLLPSCGFMYLYYSESSDIIREEISSSILQTLKQTEINLSNKLDHVANVSDMLIAHAPLYEYLNEHKSYTLYDEWRNYIELEFYINSIVRSQNVFTIRLFLQPRIPYSRERIQFFSMADIRSEEDYANIVAQNGAIYWKSTYEEKYLDKRDTFIISAARMVRNPRNYDQLLGILMVDIEEARIYDILSTVELEKEQLIYIVDEQGIVISHPDKEQLGRRSGEDITASIGGRQEGYYRQGYGRQAGFVLFHRIPLTDWTIVAEIPANQIYGRGMTLNKISGIVVVVMTSVLFMLIISLIFASVVESISRNIRRMNARMRKEGLDKWQPDKRQDDKEQTDIHMLDRSISSMIETVKDLTEDSRAKIREKDALLTALQAQINPHFLYNTLDTINWLAIRKNAPDISALIDALSRYFRLSLNNGKDIVRVDDELNQVKAYLAIQEARFPANFTVTLEIDPDTLRYSIPKLTLQPIVENALLHGILPNKGTEGRLSIKTYLSDPFLVFEIRDNGVGMTREQVAAMTDPTPGPEQRTSYGYYNVNERVKLFSGEFYQISIDSDIGEGTTVKLAIAMKAIEDASAVAADSRSPTVYPPI